MDSVKFYAYCKYTCGCVETVEVPKEKAGHIIEQDIECPNCREQKKQDVFTERVKRQNKLVLKSDDEIRGNITKSADMGFLATLEGNSDKAIAYATSIREKFIKKWTLNGELNEKAKMILENEIETDFWFSIKDEIESISVLENYHQIDKSSLAALEGSEAQIKWAEKIRLDFIRKYKSDSDFIVEYETNAKFWIENKDNLTKDEFVFGYEPNTSKNELIELIGTPKQIKLATVIVKRFARYALKYLSDDCKVKAARIIQTQSDAAWYIENREYLYNQDFIEKTALIVKEQDAKVTLNISEIKESDKAIAIHPEKEPLGILILILSVDRSLEVHCDSMSKKLQSFLKENLVYNNGSVWKRDLSELTGNYIDRATELGIKLLDEGYSVAVRSSTVRKMICERYYLPEETRWIVEADPKNVALLARNPSKALTQIAMNITGAHYDSNVKGIIVPYTSAKEIMNFADKNKYAIKAVAKTKLMRQLQKEG